MMKRSEFLIDEIQLVNNPTSDESLHRDDNDENRRRFDGTLTDGSVYLTSGKRL